MSESLTRNFKIESIRADDDGEGFWATLSTEYAAPRGDVYEILLHNKSAVDLGRSPLPLVIAHDTEELNIGVVERIKIVGRKLKGFIRFSKSERVREIIEDVKAGILTNLSIGYQILEHYIEGENLIATKWAPHEVSLVSVGLDPNAGIGRSKNSENFKMTDKTVTPEPGQTRSQKAASRSSVELERDRCTQIMSIGKRRGFEKEAQEYIESGKSLDSFRNFVLNSMDDDYSPAPTGHTGVRMGFSGNDDRGGDPDYSIQRVMQALIDPRSNAAEYELGVSDSSYP